MSELDPDLRAAIAKSIGPAHHTGPAFHGGRLAADTGRFPATLRDVWSTYGLVALAGGRLRLIDPARLAPLMAYIFDGDSDLAGDVQTIAHGNLGEVVLWSANWATGFCHPGFARWKCPI